jgi:hypothetical protein
MTKIGMTVIMMATTAAEEENACDVYYQSEHSNCDGFIEANRNRSAQEPCTQVFET